MPVEGMHRPGQTPAAGAGRPARLVVLSTLFPSSVRPAAGLFVRERMFRVGGHRPLLVISPQPWFPFLSFIRRLRPGYRPMPPTLECQDGVDVYFPRFLALPGIARWLDGLSMGLSSWWLLRRLRRQYRLEAIDAHFAYPDGYAALWAGRRLGLPVSITLRGTEVPISRIRLRRGLMRRALLGADRVFSVSASLRDLALDLGVPGARTRVIGNGVDTAKFHPVDRLEARRALGLPATARVLVSVGALVERKGFHRVLEVLPRLRKRYPDLHFLIVGGPSPEGDWSARLRAQVQSLGLEGVVRFLGTVRPEALKTPLSAADVFVLATSNEGWANVFLEAMACGLPVVTTRVGGNAEVVCRPELGTLVPLGDAGALSRALDAALGATWDRQAILRYAAENAWDVRVQVLLGEFESLVDEAAARPGAAKAPRLVEQPEAGPRLALVGPVPPPAGGMANQTRQLARLLGESGIRVELVATNAPGGRLWASHLRGVRAIPRLLFFVMALWRAFGRTDICHLMANSGWSWHLFAAPAIWLAWLRGVPVVVNYRGGQAPEFLAREVRLVRPTLRRADTLVVPSGFLQQVFASHGFESQLVPNVIDLQRFRPALPPAFERPPNILVARNLEAIYGIDCAIEALARLREEHPTARLTVAGSGPEEGALRALARRLGVAGAVSFTGPVDGEAMPRLYREAAVALNASHADNMPNSVLEALASGVPVVSTRVGGVPFIVRHGHSALLVPPGDPAAMAAALGRLLGEPELAGRLTANGLEAVRQYDWAEVRERLLELYRQRILARRRGLAPGDQGAGP